VVNSIRIDLYITWAQGRTKDSTKFKCGKQSANNAKNSTHKTLCQVQQFRLTTLHKACETCYTL